MPLGINWQRKNGAGWAHGDFNGDGTVNATDLNAIGVNWQTSLAAPLAVHQRAPREPLVAAPFAAVASQPTNGLAVLDWALDDLSDTVSESRLRRIAGKSTNIAADRDSEFRPAIIPFVGSPPRRDTRRNTSDGCVPSDDLELKLRDDLFAKICQVHGMLGISAQVM